MYALSDVIDFLLELLTDDAKRAAFEEDPEGELRDAGLDGLSGQDVRDAQLVMADSGAARPNSDGGGGGGGGGGGAGASAGGGADAVTQITHVTRHYHADPDIRIVQIDDRDTIINDSFNSDDDITVVNAEDSFNSSVENDVVAIQDNDTIIEDNDSIVVDQSAEGSEEDPDAATQEPAEGAGTEDGEPEPLRSEGIRTEDIVGSEPEPVFETEVEPVDEVEPEPEPEPEPEVDAEPDVDAAVV